MQNINGSKTNALSQNAKTEKNQNVHKTIVIDPGHGGYDSGSIGINGITEKDINLSVSLRLGNTLRKKGFNVVYTRESDNVTWPSDNKKDLAARANISNSTDTDMFISIHLNSFKMEDVNGTETYYNKENTESKKIADIIQSQIIKNVKSNDRGIEVGNFSVLRNVSAPSVLIELGYISSKREGYLLSSLSYQNNISEAIAIGIDNYFNN